jgi:hypothetical protein
LSDRRADRDKPRRDKVYAWEGQWADWNRGTLTLRECRDIVAWACKKYHVPQPKVRQHQGKADSFSQGDVISFRMSQRNPAIALHEAAHYIADSCLRPSLLDHSPQWLGIYLWLLEGYRVAPRSALWASLRAAKLRWTKTAKVSPSRIGRKKPR